MTDERHDNESAASFTDLMASMMVIFVLLFVVQLNNASAKGKAAQDDLLSDLRERLKAIGLGEEEVRQDERDRNAIVIVMPDSLLFAKGATEVRPAGQAALAQLAPLVSEVVCAEETRRNIQTVVVEGHTDTTWASASSDYVSPERARENNMELSQGRSMEVLRHTLRAVADSAQRECIRSLMSASGRGQEEPLTGIAGDDARQRRVIFKIRVTTNLAEAIAGQVDTVGATRAVAQ